jgi:hypothetical protein
MSRRVRYSRVITDGPSVVAEEEGTPRMSMTTKAVINAAKKIKVNIPSQYFTYIHTVYIFSN